MTQVIVNGVRHYKLSSYSWINYNNTIIHKLGIAYLSPDDQLGFVYDRFMNCWLMFSVKDINI